MFTQLSNRLVLNYEPGQFTFRNFVSNASDASLYELALHLNSFQEDEVKQIRRIREFELVL